MQVITRFAPSPTGILHTGSARTALFNYLFSKHHSKNSKFLLRIEDTDQARSTKEFEKSIIEDLAWLGLEWDDQVVYQLARTSRHQEIAYKLLEIGHAYYCYSTKEEIEDFRLKNPNAKFHSPYRDVKIQIQPHDKPVIRLKAPQDGMTTIKDLIQGDITIQNKELDDMILLRSDGTPTYMLAVVVDDHDMQISHIIRGDDHLTNAFRQKQIYLAMGWDIPYFAHIPLIHDKQGRKLSKRSGALGIAEYKQMGYLPESVCNHLLRLGFGYKDLEIIPMQTAIEIFSLAFVGKSPARFDIDKLNYINAHYLKEHNPVALFDMMKQFLPKHAEIHKQRILKAMPALLDRSNTLAEMANNALMYIRKAPSLDAKAKSAIENGASEVALNISYILQNLNDSQWTIANIKEACNLFATNHNIQSSAVMQALRATVVGNFAGGSIYEVIEILGKEETLARISAAPVIPNKLN